MQSVRNQGARLVRQAASAGQRHFAASANAAKTGNKYVLPVVAAATAAGAAAFVASEPAACQNQTYESVHDSLYKPKAGYPTISIEEVKKHYERSTRMWVTFRGGVYDITDFYFAHPGGTPRLLMASGNDLEPFWKIYRQHYRGHVVSFLEKYRIGNLSKEDAAKMTNEFEFGDAYEDDPPRHPDLVGCTLKPWCGECRTERLTENYFTPNELFYVRNHLPVPNFVGSEEDWELVIEGEGVKRTVFTLAELKSKFTKHRVVTTLQCAGNRREDFHGRPSHDNEHVFISPHWVIGAIGNAEWGGARMRDVFEYCGLPVDDMALGKKVFDNIRHVQFEAYDEDECGMTYGGSLPIDKVVDGLGDALFAYEMNRMPIPRDHGYPCRGLAPGHAGCRSAKWVHKAIVGKEESDKPWHQKSYRLFAPDVNFERDLSGWPEWPNHRGQEINPNSMVRLDQAKIVQEMPVQSIVCNPPPNAVIGTFGKDFKKMEVKGVAVGFGGRGIVRVDVSLDGGAHFTAAELHKPIKQIRNRDWGWYHFTKMVDVPEEIQQKLRKGEKVDIEITSKAVNGDGNVQPENLEPYWNSRGVCINHWYRVPVTLDGSTKYSKEDNEQKNYEFGNTPSTGKFAKPWHTHGWSNPMGDTGRGFAGKTDGVWSEGALHGDMVCTKGTMAPEKFTRAVGGDGGKAVPVPQRTQFPNNPYHTIAPPGAHAEWSQVEHKYLPGLGPTN